MYMVGHTRLHLIRLGRLLYLVVKLGAPKYNLKQPNTTTTPKPLILTQKLKKEKEVRKGGRQGSGSTRTKDL